ncbi:MAG: hypothetical protein ACRDFB_01530 [Rhabdochlamydiaceae bacterium]
MECLSPHYMAEQFGLSEDEFMLKQLDDFLQDRESGGDGKLKTVGVCKSIEHPEDCYDWQFQELP